MSNSELSTPPDITADAEIEQCLRRVVRIALENDEQITVNSARTRTEVELGLDTGFFKDNVEWKQRSKTIISLAAEEAASSELATAGASNPKPASKNGTKRKCSEAQPKNKRLKKSVTDVRKDSLSREVREDDRPKAMGTKNNKLSKQTISDSEEELNDDDEGEANMKSKRDSSSLSDPAEDLTGKGAATADVEPAGDDGSDLSSVIDEPPTRPRKKKSTSPLDTKDKIKKAAKPAKAGKDSSPDELEIKRLQSCLLKCGVRKVWSRELKRFDSNKEKIIHLKSALKDIGMTGRFNADKARQIKESRELAAELEAAQEFNKHWGQNGGGEEENEDGSDNDGLKDEPQPRRLRPKGLVDFGDSGDEGSD